VPTQSVEQLKVAILHGPTGVSVDAGNAPFRFYQSGILDDPACGTALNHAIAAVGYGVEDGKEYYIVRNSWSASWGDQGYIRIAAVPGDGICGIQIRPVWATMH